MIQKLRSWLIRHRDQTAVSYNRFGRPGEEEDDKPPPSKILVAPFNENAPEFILFGQCHVQKAAVYFASFGMSMVILLFVSTFFEFDWYNHRRGVDFSALLGMLLMLAVGVLSHYWVIRGVQKQSARYLLLFIAVYSVLCTFETFMCMALVFKILEPESTIVMANGITVQHPPFGWILLGVLIVLSVQGIMLTTVMRARQYLSQKQLHEMALKVAEKSRTEFPSIQIVIAGQNSNASSYSPPPSSNASVESSATANGAAAVSGVQQNGHASDGQQIV